MHDWWKEIHKNVNFSGGNIIYVKRSGQPWGNPPQIPIPLLQQRLWLQMQAAMIAVSWIGLRLGMQFNMPESTYIRWKLQKPNEITPNGCRSASGGQHTKKKREIC